jgi:hypothetical protein
MQVLIEATFIDTLPVPLPRTDGLSPPACPWSQLAINARQQRALLADLSKLFKHYVASCWTLPPNASVHGSRILTLACIVAAYDAAMRVTASQGESTLTSRLLRRLNIAGTDLSVVGTGTQLAAVTQGLPLMHAGLAVRRDQAAAYFASQQQCSDRLLLDLLAVDSSFMVHETSGSAHTTVEFATALMEEMGVAETRAPMLDFIQYKVPEGASVTAFENAIGWLIDDAPAAPEWRGFMDMIIIFKHQMLHWTSQSIGAAEGVEKASNARQTFQRRDVRLSWNMTSVGKRRSGDINLSLGVTVRGKPLQLKGKVYELLCRPEHYLASARTEDDVMFAPRLPDFKGRFTQEESERLLCLLTAPYLRIPLLLHFFEDDLIGSLGSLGIQQLIESALFSPGLWAAEDALPEVEFTPANPEVVATAYGLLYNELAHSPACTLEPLLSMLDRSLRLAAGDYASPYIGIFLFVARLAVRVEGYAARVLADGRGVAELRDLLTRLREARSSAVRPKLRSWITQAYADDDRAAAAKLNAHLAMTLRYVPSADFRLDDALTFAAVAYVVAWHGHGRGDETDAEGADLMIPEEEVFGVVQAQRVTLLTWLQAAGEEVVQAVVGAVFSGSTNGTQAVTGWVASDVSGLALGSLRRWPYACGGVARLSLVPVCHWGGRDTTVIVS